MCVCEYGFVWQRPELSDGDDDYDVFRERMRFVCFHALECEVENAETRVSEAIEIHLSADSFRVFAKFAQYEVTR